MPGIKPRELKPISVSGEIEASAWYYRRPKSDEVVVEVRQPGGNYIGTVTVRVRHPRGAQKQKGSA